MKVLIYCFSFFVLTIVSCSNKVVSGYLASTDTSELRVMTYNIHHANPPSKIESGEIDLNAIANVIKRENPDIVALQEVEMNTIRSGETDQAKALAEKLGMQAFFGRAIDFEGGYYGVAILSKYPLTETLITPLPEDADPEAEDRVLITANITLPNGEIIRFGSTHLDVRSERNRNQQVKAINKIASKEHLPFIIAGDFNSVPESNAIAELDKQFTRTCIENCEPTIPVDNPNRTLDYIVYTKDSPFRVVSQKVIQEKYASDHLPVVATLELTLNKNSEENPEE